MEHLKSRLGITAEGSRRNGAMVTWMEPEAVVRRTSAGALVDDSDCGMMAMLMSPDMLLMERRSWSAKVPVTLSDLSLMTVVRDMAGDLIERCCTWVFCNFFSVFGAKARCWMFFWWYGVGLKVGCYDVRRITLATTVTYKPFCVYK